MNVLLVKYLLLFLFLLLLFVIENIVSKDLFSLKFHSLALF